MYGAKLGHGACEALFDLATSEEDFVRCAQATTDALLNALATLETRRTVVLDLVALTTLRLLGVTRQVLTSARFVSSSRRDVHGTAGASSQGPHFDSARHDVFTRTASTT
jgi:hypothetical protein